MARSRGSQGLRWRCAALLVVAAIWLGMLLGVSFLATPAKFLAPSLTLPVALDVGRHTFAAFNKAEWVLAAALLLAFAAGARGWPIAAGVAVAVALLLAETVWLLPALDARVGMILAGQPPRPSGLHYGYIACDAAKLLVLAVVMGAGLRQLLAGPAAEEAGRSGLYQRPGVIR